MKIAGAIVLILTVVAGCVKVGPAKLTEAKKAGLIQGYPALYENIKEFGCPKCHTTGPQTIPNRFKLPPPGENDEVAVHMLWERLDTLNVAESKLVRKPNGDMGHRGGKILNPPKKERWIQELMRWYRS